MTAKDPLKSMRDTAAIVSQVIPTREEIQQAIPSMRGETTATVLSLQQRGNQLNGSAGQIIAHYLAAVKVASWRGGRVALLLALRDYLDENPHATIVEFQALIAQLIETKPAIPAIVKDDKNGNQR